jgi:adenylate cyclase
MEDDLEKSVDSILKASWDITDGQVVPETQDLALANAGRKLEVTILYADLADSTELAMYDQQIAAEVYKSYLLGTTKIIKSQGGQIRSFDGDRVMGVFIGNSKNTSAAKAALKINYFFGQILQPKFSTFYPGIASSSFKFAQSVGIDTGEVRVARAGVRVDNDLIWVGGPANIAAKLSSIREPGFSSYITDTVYNMLHESAKVFNTTSMWESRTWPNGRQYGRGSIYRSSWWLRPSYNS